MKVKVHFIDFHWDNYQGARGKTIESSFMIDIPDSLAVGEVIEFISNTSNLTIKRIRPFPQDNHYHVVRVEII